MSVGGPFSNFPFPSIHLRVRIVVWGCLGIPRTRDTKCPCLLVETEFIQVNLDHLRSFTFPFLPFLKATYVYNVCILCLLADELTNTVRELAVPFSDNG
jgi:hypothetical protein